MIQSTQEKYNIKNTKSANRRREKISKSEKLRLLRKTTVFFNIKTAKSGQITLLGTQDKWILCLRIIFFPL